MSSGFPRRSSATSVSSGGGTWRYPLLSYQRPLVCSSGSAEYEHRRDLCNWYYTWSRTQFYPPGTSAASLSSEPYDGMRHEDPSLQELARQLRDHLGSLMGE